MGVQKKVHYAQGISKKLYRIIQVVPSYSTDKMAE